METCTKEPIKTTKEMAKVLIITTVEESMLESGKKTANTDKASTPSPTEIPTKECIKTIRNVDTESSSGLTETGMKAITQTMKEMDKAHTIITQEACIEDSGRTTINMERDSIPSQMEPLSMAAMTTTRRQVME